MKQEVHCDCGRYLFTAVGTVLVEQIVCAGCKARKNVKIVTTDSSENDHKYKFTTIEKGPKE